jgi:hypothetical protein
MFEKFTRRDAGDFRQRYLGTFGFFRRGDSKPLLTKINSIDNVVTFSDKDGISYTLNPDTPNDIGFEFIPPKAAWHNTTDGAYLVKRIPARQWLRGVSPKNTSIATPHGKKAVVDFPILEQIYGKTYPMTKAQEAFYKQASRTGFLAISDQIAVDYSLKQVWCLDMTIGSWEGDPASLFKIKLNDPELWNTEVRDAFNRAEMKMEIAE